MTNLMNSASARALRSADVSPSPGSTSPAPATKKPAAKKANGKKAAAKPTPTKKKAKAVKAGSSTRWNGTEVITVLKQASPVREGTRLDRCFRVARTGQTVAEFAKRAMEANKQDVQNVGTAYAVLRYLADEHGAVKVTAAKA